MTEPLGAYDAGDDLFIVVDIDGGHLSYHRTEDGATKMREADARAAGIDKAELHY